MTRVCAGHARNLEVLHVVAKGKGAARGHRVAVRKAIYDASGDRLVLAADGTLRVWGHASSSRHTPDLCIMVRKDAAYWCRFCLHYLKAPFRAEARARALLCELRRLGRTRITLQHAKGIH